MTKYDKMSEANRQESEKKIELAIAEIRRAASEGNVISVFDFSRNTGLSKGFFYKNEQVRSILYDISAFTEKRNILTNIRAYVYRVKESLVINVPI